MDLFFFFLIHPSLPGLFIPSAAAFRVAPGCLAQYRITLFTCHSAPLTSITTVWEKKKKEAALYFPLRSGGGAQPPRTHLIWRIENTCVKKGDDKKKTGMWWKQPFSNEAWHKLYGVSPVLAWHLSRTTHFRGEFLPVLPAVPLFAPAVAIGPLAECLKSLASRLRFYFKH